MHLVSSFLYLYHVGIKRPHLQRFCRWAIICNALATSKPADPAGLLVKAYFFLTTLMRGGSPPVRSLIPDHPSYHDLPFPNMGSLLIPVSSAKFMIVSFFIILVPSSSCRRIAIRIAALQEGSLGTYCFWRARVMSISGFRLSNNLAIRSVFDPDAFSSLSRHISFSFATGSFFSSISFSLRSSSSTALLSTNASSELSSVTCLLVAEVCTSCATFSGIGGAGF
mmetsp:Transcript_13435/g.16974  ORF Transcript_13435/g.16974 Transcript_13435/m.16974 type:complete len:224 (+) Transcript_13435:95-766(+)